MQIPCVYIPGPAPAVSVANTYSKILSRQSKPNAAWTTKLLRMITQLLPGTMKFNIDGYIFSSVHHLVTQHYFRSEKFKIINTLSGIFCPWNFKILLFFFHFFVDLTGNAWEILKTVIVYT